MNPAEVARQREQARRLFLAHLWQNLDAETRAWAARVLARALEAGLDTALDEIPRPTPMTLLERTAA